MLPWTLCALLAALLLAALLKLRTIRKSLGEIAQALGERLETDTNNLLFVSCRDRAVRRLASALNAQLRQLRSQRRRCQSGDRELKEAVTNISHDLRTPLTAICGYLDLLEREEKSEAVSRYLSLVGNRVEAMRQLTEELFRYSVILSAGEELELEPVCLNGAVEEAAAEFYAALAGRGIVPDIRLCEAKVVRPLNRAALSRVLGNVLGNALKYSGGDLNITLSEDGELVFANAAPGLDAVQAGRLFDRFFSVAAARNSTGLGLAIARNLTERMGGRIFAACEGERLEIHLVFPPRG